MRRQKPAGPNAAASGAGGGERELPERLLQPSTKIASAFPSNKWTRHVNWLSNANQPRTPQHPTRMRRRAGRPVSRQQSSSGRQAHSGHFIVTLAPAVLQLSEFCTTSRLLNRKLTGPLSRGRRRAAVSSAVGAAEFPHESVVHTRGNSVTFGVGCKNEILEGARERPVVDCSAPTNGGLGWELESFCLLEKAAMPQAGAEIRMHAWIPHGALLVEAALAVGLVVVGLALHWAFVESALWQDA